MARLKEVLSTAPQGDQRAQLTQTRTINIMRMRRRDSTVQLSTGGGVAAVALGALALAPVPVVGEVALIGAAAVAGVAAVDALAQKWKLHREVSKAKDLAELAEQQQAKIDKRIERNNDRLIPKVDGNVSLGEAREVRLQRLVPEAVVQRRWAPIWLYPVPFRKATVIPVDVTKPVVSERSWGGRGRAVKLAVQKATGETGNIITDGDRVVGGKTSKDTNMALHRWAGNKVRGHRVVLFTTNDNQYHDATWVWGRSDNRFDTAAQRAKISKRSGKPKLSRFHGLRKRI